MNGFRNRLLKAVRDTMSQDDVREIKFTTWSGESCDGFEIMYESVVKSRKQVFGLVVNMFKTLDNETYEAIMNPYMIKDGQRQLLKSNTLKDSIELTLDVANILSHLILASTSAPNLSNILGIHVIRDKLLTMLRPQDVFKLSAVNRLIRSYYVNSHTDTTYWKRKLKNRFGKDSVKTAVASQKTFRRQFIEMHEAEKTCTPLYSTIPHQVEVNSRIAPQIYDGSRVHFNPLDPIPNPRHPYDLDDHDRSRNRLLIQQHPRPRGNADLDPFGDPMQREIFRPPRGPGGGFGGNPFSQFDRNDFI